MGVGLLFALGIVVLATVKKARQTIAQVLACVQQQLARQADMWKRKLLIRLVLLELQATRHAELEAIDSILADHGGDVSAADFARCGLQHI